MFLTCLYIGNTAERGIFIFADFLPPIVLRRNQTPRGNTCIYLWLLDDGDGFHKHVIKTASDSEIYFYIISLSISSF